MEITKWQVEEQILNWQSTNVKINVHLKGEIKTK